MKLFNKNKLLLIKEKEKLEITNEINNLRKMIKFYQINFKEGVQLLSSELIKNLLISALSLYDLLKEELIIRDYGNKRKIEKQNFENINYFNPEFYVKNDKFNYLSILNIKKKKEKQKKIDLKRNNSLPNLETKINLNLFQKKNSFSEFTLSKDILFESNNINSNFTFSSKELIDKFNNFADKISTQLTIDSRISIN